MVVTSAIMIMIVDQLSQQYNYHAISQAYFVA